jgi:hypothetical protein
MLDRENGWPLPNYRSGPYEHLHALGVISLNFNMYESSLVIPLEFYLPKSTASFVVNRESHQRRVAAIKHFVSINEPNQQMVGAIDHALKHFDACYENRNILLHSKLSFNAVDARRYLTLEKLSNKAEFIQFHFSLSELQRVADEMMDGVFYLSDIWIWWDFQKAKSRKPLAEPNWPLPPKIPVRLEPKDLL